MTIYDVTYVEVPGSADLLREAPRPQDKKQENYDERFDWFTLFSDIYRVNSAIRFVSPPLRNFSDLLANSTIQDATTGAQLKVRSTPMDRMEKGEFEGFSSENTSTILISSPKLQLEFDIQKNASPDYTGLRVLVTQQRDNPLEWIAYWACFNVVINRVNAVLIYDNASATYSVDDLHRVLESVPGLEKIGVVRWPTPWGATGGEAGIWDSDYGQHVYLEHARHRFLAGARSALICDIDELPFSTTADSFLDNLENSDAAVALFPRRQVHHMLTDGFTDEDTRVHRNYNKVTKDFSYLNTKFAVVPERLTDAAQMKAHYVRGVPESSIVTTGALAGHFGGIRVDWRAGEFTPITNAKSWGAPIEEYIEMQELFDVVEAAWSQIAIQFD